jgi:hypothetical protein
MVVPVLLGKVTPVLAVTVVAQDQAVVHQPVVATSAVNQPPAARVKHRQSPVLRLRIPQVEHRVSLCQAQRTPAMARVVLPVVNTPVTVAQALLLFVTLATRSSQAAWSRKLTATPCTHSTPPLT